MAAKPGTVGKPSPPTTSSSATTRATPLPRRRDRDRVPRRRRKRAASSTTRTREDAERRTAGDYFTLGDVGYLDDDGYLFLTDRSANLIISGGVNIYPAEVDAVLLAHPAVHDAAMIGIPNEEWGEEVKAVVELHPASSRPTSSRAS